MGVGAAVLVNLVSFACVANSNPGYVDEGDDEAHEEGRLRVTELAEGGSLEGRPGGRGTRGELGALEGRRGHLGAETGGCRATSSGGESTSFGGGAEPGDVEAGSGSLGGTEIGVGLGDRSGGGSGDSGGDETRPGSRRSVEISVGSEGGDGQREVEEGDGTAGLLGMPGGVWNGSGGGGGSKSVDPDADDDAAAADDDDDDDAVPGGQMCKHCDAWQGLRTKHCHDCGRCVRRFDHHCFWVGTCVGEKNHARFVFYLASQNALILWAFHIASSGVRYRPTAREMLDDNAGAVMMCVALLLFILFVGSLLGEATSLCSMCDTVRRSAC